MKFNTKSIFVYWDQKIESKDHPIVLTLEDYKSVNPDYSVGIIERDQVKEFLKKDFNFLYEYFDIFKIYSIRSDLSRIVHLYLNGGFYCDSHVKIYSSLNDLEIEEQTNTNKDSHSFMCGPGCISFMYSDPKDEIWMDCLKVAEIKLKEIIEKDKHKAGKYAHAMHVAVANGLYVCLTRSGELVRNPGEESGAIQNFFRKIKQEGNNLNIFRRYRNPRIMTSGTTRAGNKHWSSLCNEIDMI